MSRHPLLRSPLSIFRRLARSEAETSLSQAYAQYGAELKSTKWSVSGRSPAGELVINVWTYRGVEDRHEGTLTFRDTLEGWSGPGYVDFREALQEAFLRDCPVRPVFAHATVPTIGLAIPDARLNTNRFEARPEWIGRVTRFDGSYYSISFLKMSAAVFRCRAESSRCRGDVVPEPENARNAATGSG